MKQSRDQYRNIGGVHYIMWTADASQFDGAKLECKRLGIKYRVIDGQFYREHGPGAYIKDGLQGLADGMDGMTLSYSYDRVYDQHVIRVSPVRLYNTRSFAKIQMEFEYNFITFFPSESLYVTSEDKVKPGDKEFTVTNSTALNKDK